MNEWFVKEIIYPSKHVPLAVILNYLRQASSLASQNDKLPLVEIVIDGKSYLLMHEQDFRERFGE